MDIFFSCIAVSRACWDSILSMLISSMYSTPLFALWMSPASSLSWDGVSRPPDWNGSCLTSPRRAPAWVPVASTNGGMSPGSCPTSTFGTMAVSVLGCPGVLKKSMIMSAPRSAIHTMVKLLSMIAARSPMTMIARMA